MQSKVVLIFGKNVLAGLAPCGGHGAGTFDTLTFLRGMNQQTLGDFPLGLSSPYCALGLKCYFRMLRNSFKIIHQMTILMKLTKTIRLRLNFNERLSILIYGHLSLYKLKPGFHMLAQNWPIYRIFARRSGGDFPDYL